MRWMHILALRVRSLVRRSRVEAELDAELRFHLDQQAQAFAARGSSADEARSAARRALGGVEQRKEECRDARRVRIVEDAVRDLRYALRMLRRSPGFTIVAVVSLALGIGAASAVAGVIHSVLPKKLPVTDPDSLVYFREHVPPDRTNDEHAYPRIERLRDGARSFASLSMMNVFDRSNIAISTAGGGAAEVDPGRARVALVSGNYFETLGISAAIGRTFTVDADRGWGAHPLAVVSNAYWDRRTARTPDVIGRTLTLNDTRFTIIGVMPRAFTGEWIGRPVDVWIPWTMHQQVLIEQPGPLIKGNDNWLHVFARLKRDVTIEPARAEVLELDQRALRDFAGPAATELTRRRIAETRMTLEPSARGYSPQREKLTDPLIIRAVLIGLVLVVACGNVASLLLARAAHRQREIAVRLAIGAGTERLRRQLLTEGVVLSAFGGALGLALAVWGAKALGAGVVAGPVDMFWGRSSWIAFDAHVDLAAIVFTVALSLRGWSPL